MDFKLTSNRAYIRAIKRALRRKRFKEVEEREEEEEGRKYTVSSSKENCDYCVEFRNFKSVDFFNKVITTYKLMNCDYYPPSLVVKDENKWRKVRIDSNKYYYVKPKYGSQCKNISVLKGKEVIINNQDSINSFPFALQEEITPKLDDEGRKSDFRTFVLYVKENNNIRVFYAPEHLLRYCKDAFEERTKDSFFSYGDDCEKRVIENTSDKLEECLKDAQRYILPKFNYESHSKLEFFLCGYDLIEDLNGKFWIMEINSDPNVFQYDCVKLHHQRMFKDIINSILRHIDTEKFDLDYFIEIS